MRVGITRDNFNKEVVNSDKPVIVDVWASWCMPCKMMDNVLTTVENNLGTKVKFVSLEMDVENDDFVKTFGISSIPTLLVYNKGVEVKRQIGVCAPQTIISFMQEFIDGQN